MTKRILFFIVAFLSFLYINAQNDLNKILNEIEKNNTSLAAIRDKSDAEKLGNAQGIYLENPQIGFNYLWGNPTTFGNRRDFSISQSFDFPTAYSHKNQLADIKNEQVDLVYQTQRQELLFKTSLLCYDLIYTNALLAEIGLQLLHAKEISNAYSLKYEKGEISILEFNKAQLNLVNLEEQFSSVEIERTVFQSQLDALNGGKHIDFTDSIFSMHELPSDFDHWFEQVEKTNASLNYMKKEVEGSAKQVQLNKAMSLPKLKAGYMSEYIVGQNLRGVSVGVSIPLWENKNTVKHAKAYSQAMENVVIDQRFQMYNQLKIQYKKAKALQQNANDYRERLVKYDNSNFLYKALNKGEIDLLVYMLEHSMYHDSLLKLLELERQALIAVAELYKTTL